MFRSPFSESLHLGFKPCPLSDLAVPGKSSIPILKAKFLIVYDFRKQNCSVSKKEIVTPQRGLLRYFIAAVCPWEKFCFLLILLLAFSLSVIPA